MPTPDDTNRLDDLRRDLGDVVGGNPEGRKNFVDDLRVLVDLGDKPDAAPAIDRLAQQVADAAGQARSKRPTRRRCCCRCGRPFPRATSARSR